MLLEQLVDGDGPCTFVVACTDTRTAALVDPHPERLTQVAAFLAEHRLQGVWVIDTRRADLTALGTVERFRGLLGELGLSTRELGPPAPRGALDLSSHPQVRPLRTWSPRDEGRISPVVLQVGQRILELHPDRLELPTFDASRPAAHPFDFAFRGVSLPVGKLRIEIVPLPDRPEAVACSVQDRLLVGTPVLAGTDALTAEATPLSLLALPAHTVVHAGVVRSGVGVSTVGLERAALAAREASTRSPPPSVAWAPRLVQGGVEARLPRGELHAEGFTSIAPQEAWRCLDTLVVLDLREGSGLPDGIGGARSVWVGNLQDEVGGGARETPVLLVCETGKRAPSAAALLACMGFTHVFALAGGLEQWREVGLPLRAAGGLPCPLDDNQATGGHPPCG